jgi:hypothetical protein
MYKITYDGVSVTIKNGQIPEEEMIAYVDRGRERFGSSLVEVIVTLDPADDDMVDLEYISKRPFHRLRRITGYLVGTLGRWNNGKRAEEHDRVKHYTEVGKDDPED